MFVGIPLAVILLTIVAVLVLFLVVFEGTTPAEYSQEVYPIHEEVVNQLDALDGKWDEVHDIESGDQGSNTSPSSP